MHCYCKGIPRIDTALVLARAQPPNRGLLPPLPNQMIPLMSRLHLSIILASDTVQPCCYPLLWCFRVSPITWIFPRHCCTAVVVKDKLGNWNHLGQERTAPQSHPVEDLWGEGGTVWLALRYLHKQWFLTQGDLHIVQNTNYLMSNVTPRPRREAKRLLVLTRMKTDYFRSLLYCVREKA
jgi:hypothetical protein